MEGIRQCTLPPFMTLSRDGFIGVARIWSGPSRVINPLFDIRIGLVCGPSHAGKGLKAEPEHDKTIFGRVQYVA